MYVVSGANGFIGNSIVRHLVASKEEVLVLVRKYPIDSLKDIEVKYAVGDIGDLNFLLKNIPSGSIVIHSAGVIDTTNRNPNTFRVNVNGTKNILDAAITNGAASFIYVSSVDAIYKENKDVLTGIPDNFYPEKMNSDYSISKSIATKYVLGKLRSKVIDGSIIYPSAVIGPGDYKISKVGESIIRMLDHKLMATFPGKYNFIDVRDVALITYLVSKMEHKALGYMATGEVVSVYDLIKKTYHILGYKRMPINVPFWLIRFASIFVDWYAILFNKDPLFNSFVIKTLSENCNYDNRATLNEFNVTLKTFDETLKDTIAFFKEIKGK